MSTTYTDISEQDWRDQFRPHDTTYGYFTEAERRVLEQAHAERRLWTYGFTGAGNPWIVQGWAYVDREFYIICDVPVPEGIEYTIDMGSTCFCELCGEWFRDQNDSPESVKRSSLDTSLCMDCAPTEEDDRE